MELILQNSCKVCGGQQYKERWRENAGQILQCNNCGFGWVDKIPVSKEFYSHLYNYKFDPKHYDQMKWRDPVYNGILEIAQRHVATGTLLDVGSCTGRFLDFAYTRGYDVSGVEYNKSAVEYSREKYNYPVHCGDFVDLDLGSNSYDVVTIIDCLFHFNDPATVFSKCKKILKHGGFLILRTPNFDFQVQRNLLKRAFNSRDSLINDFTKTSFFTPRTFEFVFRNPEWKLNFYKGPLSGTFSESLTSPIRNRIARILNPVIQTVKYPLGFHFVTVAQKIGDA